MVLALRLGGGMSAGNEPVNNHFLPIHHICFLIVLSCFWLGYLGGGVGHFNGLVDFSALRYAFS